MEQISLPFSAPASSPTSSTASAVGTDLIPAVLFAVWACGFVAILLVWCVRWRRIRAAVRGAAPLSVESNVTVFSSPALLEPGVFGIVHPVLVLPEGIADHLTSAELRAILDHELSHIRSRDNLAAALHMVVEAFFWFHPFIWWIGARLVEERELACDEEVLRLGSEPQTYAQGILKTCQFYLESPLPCVSGVTGADLKKRIVRIMTHRAASNLGVGRKLLLFAAGIAAIGGPLLLGAMNAPAHHGRFLVANSLVPELEVTSIRPGKSNPPFRVLFRAGHFSATGISLKAMIHFAYGVQDYQIAGGPAWLNTERYDIEAKAPHLLTSDLRNMSEEQRNLNLDRNRRVLQNLMANRFELTLHTESKDAPIYALVVAKGGFKLKEATAEELAPPSPKDLASSDSPESMGKLRGRGIRLDNGELTAQAVKLSQMADVLSNLLGRNVLDKTGLKGAYDFTLRWTPNESHDQMFKRIGEAPPPIGSAQSILTAIHEQLGLKLEPQQGPIEILVIDRAQKPLPN